MTSTSLVQEQDDLQTTAASMFNYSQHPTIKGGSFYSIGRDAHIHQNSSLESGTIADGGLLFYFTDFWDDL